LIFLKAEKKNNKKLKKIYILKRDQNRGAILSGWVMKC
jgi:hypothetical protein